MKPRVILIRENPETLTCSNCAGSLEGIDAFGSHEVADYEPVRQVVDQVGELYRALRSRFGNRIAVDAVDPRNAIYLIPALISDFLRYRPPFRALVKTLAFGISPASVILNGRVLHVGTLPAPHRLVERVANCVDAPGFNQP